MIYKKMNLAEIKTSNISKRKLFQIERAVVREITDLWYLENSYFSDDFTNDVEVKFEGKKVHVDFPGKIRMRHGAPEATINDMMKGMIVTMATDQKSGQLLKIHKSVIGNILDVFVYRLKEIAGRKFVFQRLQTLELGFSIAFGLDNEFYPIKKARRLLEEALTVAGLSSAVETVEILIHDMFSAEILAQKDQGVTFHIFMATEDEASFISLPLGMVQSSYVSLLGTHTLRCNLLGELEGGDVIKTGILKIDAPSEPLNFIHHKGLDLHLEEKSLMEKLCSTENHHEMDFSDDEILFLKLLFNEYVNVASFLLGSKKIDPGLKLLIIFPRLNIFKILGKENSLIPDEEPQSLAELADLRSMLFPIQIIHGKRKKEKSYRIPEKIVQQKVFVSINALVRHTLVNIYKPLTDIKRILFFYEQRQYRDKNSLVLVKQKVGGIAAYLKKLNRVQRVVLDGHGNMDIDASISDRSEKKQRSALAEIIQNIQAAEIEHSREVVVSKMLDYLSFISVRLEQLEKVSSNFIKQEIIKEIESNTVTILSQAKAFYKLLLKNQAGKP